MFRDRALLGDRNRRVVSDDDAAGEFAQRSALPVEERSHAVHILVHSAQLGNAP